MKPRNTRQNKTLLKPLIILMALVLSLPAIAQVPMKFNYQAVARNANGTPITNQSVGIRISILDGGPTGTALYIEHQVTTTNAFGVFSLAVGGGTVETGTMGTVQWSNGNIWMEVQMDATGGTDYETMGTTQLLSVPYAMVAGTAIAGGNGKNSGPISLDSLSDVILSNPLPGQVLKYDGTSWYNGVDTSQGGGGNSVWNMTGNDIFNLNTGNVGIGTDTPGALFDVQMVASAGKIANFNNLNAGNTGNVLSVENNGEGYNFYSYKTGSSESVYLVKNNTGSGTPNVYATNNGAGNTMDVFATGTGYAGNFRGGATSAGGIYAGVTSTTNAATFDGGATGNAIDATVSGGGFAGLFNGQTKVSYDCSNTASPHLQLYETSATAYARMNFLNSSGTNYWQIAGMPNATATSARLSFLYNSSEYLTFTGDGEIGIANTSPAARLDIAGSTTYTNPILNVANTNATGSAATVIISSSGNGDLMTGTKTGIGYGLDIQKTNTLSSSATIYGSTAGSAGEGVRGAAFGAGGYGVYGNAAGNGSASFTGVYGYGSGSTGVDYGIYGQQGTGTNDYAGYFNGNVGYTGNLSSTSDERLKNNIRPLDNGLNAIMQLRPSKYQYRHDGDYSKMNLPQGEQIGLIAQDIEKVLPQLVSQTTFNAMDKHEGETNNSPTSIDYKSVNYIGLIPVLVKAIQEQQAEIATLQAQVKELQK